MALGLIREPSDGATPTFQRRAKVVQVLRSNDSIRCLEVSDKESSIAVMLTEACYKQLFEKDPDFTLSSYRNCVVKLQTWHLSSVIQTAGDRNINQFGNLDISFPFALQCSKCSLLGAGDCTRMGEPLDVNRDPAVRQALRCMDYTTLVERLRSRQFVREASLPDPNGLFSIPQLYSEHYPLLWEHAQLPTDQRRRIKEIRQRQHTSSSRPNAKGPNTRSSRQEMESNTPSDAGYSLLSQQTAQSLSPPGSDGRDNVTVLWTQGQSRLDAVLTDDLIHQIVRDFPQCNNSTIPEQTQAETQIDFDDPTQVDSQDVASSEHVDLHVAPDSSANWFTQPIGN